MKLISKKPIEQEFIKYDIEVQDNHNFVANDIIVHNSNMRVVYWNNQLYVGSRNYWKKESPVCQFWKALHNTPEVEKFCRQNPGTTVFGECYGMVKGFYYGPQKHCSFRAFDIYDAVAGQFLAYGDAISLKTQNNIPWVPELYYGPFELEKMLALSEGQSAIGNHIKEGIVVRPITEQFNSEIGRKILKCKGFDYLNKN